MDANILMYVSIGLVFVCQAIAVVSTIGQRG